MNYTRKRINQLLEREYGCYLKLLLPDYEDSLIYQAEKLLTAETVGLNNADEKPSTLLLIIFIVFAILNVDSNTLMIIGLCKTNKRMNGTQKLFVYLSCVDLTAGCVAMPVLIYYEAVGLCQIDLLFFLCNIYLNHTDNVN